RLAPDRPFPCAGSRAPLDLAFPAPTPIPLRRRPQSPRPSPRQSMFLSSFSPPFSGARRLLVERRAPSKVPASRRREVEGRRVDARSVEAADSHASRALENQRAAISAALFLVEARAASADAPV